MGGRVRAYLGMSLDGRIAGPDDALGWLTAPRQRQVDAPVPSAGDQFLTYEQFTADVGAMLMGRRTYDVVATFDEWPYGDLPVVVATHRSVPGAPSTVTTAAGSPLDLVAAARAAAGDRDVYADGGQLVAGLLEAGLLDELVTTVLPTVRGAGVGLFDGLTGPADLDLVGVATDDGGNVQLTWLPHGD